MDLTIVKRVESLVSSSAILSSRGRYDKNIDDELTALFRKDKDSYSEGYRRAKEGFGL